MKKVLVLIVAFCFAVVLWRIVMPEPGVPTLIFASCLALMYLQFAAMELGLRRTFEWLGRISIVGICLIGLHCLYLAIFEADLTRSTNAVFVTLICIIAIAMYRSTRPSNGPLRPVP